MGRALGAVSRILTKMGSTQSATMAIMTPGAMGWPQLGIHMVCVGLPIVWGVRRAP